MPIQWDKLPSVQRKQPGQQPKPAPTGSIDWSSLGLPEQAPSSAEDIAAKVDAEREYELYKAGYSGQSLPVQLAKDFKRGLDSGMHMAFNAITLGNFDRLMRGTLSDEGKAEFDADEALPTEVKAAQKARGAEARAKTRAAVAENSIVPGAGQMMDAAEAAGTMAPASVAGAIAGPANAANATYGAMAAMFGPEHYKEAKAAGKDELSSLAHAGIQTLWEVGSEVVGGRIAKRFGGKTFEQMFDNRQVKGALGIGVGLATEGGGEAATEYLQAITSAFDGVDENALEGVNDRALHAFGVGVIMGGGAHVVDSISSAAQKFVKEPTTENAIEAGVPEEFASDPEALEQVKKGVEEAQVSLAAQAPTRIAPVAEREAAEASPDQEQTEDSQRSETEETSETDQAIPDQEKVIEPEHIPAPATNAVPDVPPSERPLADPLTEPDPQPPVEEIVPDVAPEEQKAYFQAKNAFVDKFREELGFSELPKPDADPWVDVMFRANKSGIPARAEFIAKDVIANPRALTTPETAGLVVRGAELKKIRNSVKADLQSADGIYDKQARVAQMDGAQRELETITRALRTAGTVAGQQLAVRRLSVTEDFDLAASIVRAEAAKGEDLSPTERQRIVEKTDKQDTAEKAATDFDQKQVEKAKAKKHKEVQRLQSAVQNLRKATGVEIGKVKSTDVPGLTEADLAALNSLDAKIAEVEKQLSETDTIAPDLGPVHNYPAEKAVAALDDTISRLRGELKRKTKALDKALPSALEEQQRIEKLEKELAKVNEDIAAVDEGTYTPEERKQRADVMSEKRDSLTTELAEARKTFKEKTKKPVDSMVQERNKISALERQLTKAQEELTKARSGDTTPQERQKEYDVMTKERDRLYHELEKTRKEIKYEIDSHRPKGLGFATKSTSDLLLNLLTAEDFSAVGRQAKFMLWSHPVKTIKSMGDMFKSFASETEAFHSEQEIQRRPNAALYEKGNLALSKSLGDELSTQETSLVYKLINTPLPELKAAPILRDVAELGRKTIAGSQRAYITLLNKVRADVFDGMIAAGGGPSSYTDKDIKDLGHFINVATGRGDIKSLERYMETAGVAMWAPRLLIGRIQYMTGQPAWQASPKLRKQILTEYARAAAGMASWYSLYALAYGDDKDFSVTFNPFDSDFGKIVIGDTRMDPLAGMAQVIRPVARLLFQKTSSDGVEKPLEGEEAWREIARFYRSKASPLVGLGINAITGEDVGHNNTNIRTLEGAKNLGMSAISPLALTEIDDVIRDQGLPRGAVLAMLNIFGEGMMVYEAKEAKKAKGMPWESPRGSKAKLPWEK